MRNQVKVEYLELKEIKLAKYLIIRIRNPKSPEPTITTSLQSKKHKKYFLKCGLKKFVLRLTRAKTGTILVLALSPIFYLLWTCKTLKNSQASIYCIANYTGQDSQGLAIKNLIS